MAVLSAEKVIAYSEVALALAAVIAAFIWVGSIASEVARDTAEISDQAATLARLQTADQGMALELRSQRTDIAILRQELCAQQRITDLLHATDLRLFGSMWEKVFAAPLPTENAYYPPCDGAVPSTPQP